MDIQDKPKYKVLLVDDEKEQLDKIKAIIKGSNSLREFIESIDPFLVDHQRGTEEIVNQIKECPAQWNIILSDLFMPTNGGAGSLGGLLIADTLIPFWESDPKFPVKLILISNKAGAGGKIREYKPRYDKWIYWYPKPQITDNDLARDDLSPQPLWCHAIAEAIVKLNEDNKEEPLADEVIEIGISGSMKIIKTLAGMAAENKDNILILGERGSGQILLAKYIHNKLFGKRYPFIECDCQNIPEDALQSELFGVVQNYHEYSHKGKKVGKFTEAKTGTIFLNEIGKIKDKYSILLQVLDPMNRTFQPLGEEKFTKFEGKIICATSEPLDEWVENNKFPREFYERIRYGSIIKLPPLRERTEDIVPLANYFIKKYFFDFSVDENKLSEKSIELLKACGWPDTFEEFQRAVDRAKLNPNAKELPHEDIIALTHYFQKKCSLKLRDKIRLSEEVINLLQKYDWPNNIEELKMSVDRAILISDTEELIPADFYEILKKVTKNCATVPPDINLSTLPPDKFVLAIKGMSLPNLISKTGLSKREICEKVKLGYEINLNRIPKKNITILARMVGHTKSQAFYESIENRFGLKHKQDRGFYFLNEGN